MPRAERYCPFHRAIHGNVPLTLTVRGRGAAPAEPAEHPQRVLRCPPPSRSSATRSSTAWPGSPLDRPAYRNAQSRVLLEELDEAFERAAADHDVAVIVLFGAGDHFSAGHDLGTPDEQADQRERPWRGGIRGWYEKTYDLFFANTLRWRNLPKPTIAAVQGYCIFGGWMIASAMDVIFAADDAMFLGSHFQYFAMPWDLHARARRRSCSSSPASWTRRRPSGRAW